MRATHDHKRVFLLLSLLAFALALQQRIVLSSHIPLNVDESMVLHEVQLMHGLPVHFIGYGWGENVLLAYLALPFIRSGLDPLAVLRCIVCIASIVTLLLTAHIARRWFGDWVGVATFFIGALWPWSVASGSVAFNVFLTVPMLLGAGLLFEYYIRSKKIAAAIGSGALIGFATYGYAMVFIWGLFFFGACFYVACKKNLLPGWWWMAGVCCIIAFPMLLFYAKNSFGASIPEALGPLQFPTLTASRFGNIIVGGGFLQKAGSYVWNYFSHFNFFLLSVGLFSHRYSSYFSYGWDPFLIYLALWQLLSTKKMPAIMAFWLCTYPLASSITRVDGIFALTRDVIGMPVLIMLSAYGAVFLIRAMSKFFKFDRIFR